MEIKINLNMESFFEDYDEEIGEPAGGYSLVENIENQIISTVSEKVFKIVEKNIDSQIGDLVKSKINEKTESVFNDFIDKEIKITDRYGDCKETGTVKEVIKKRFDNFLTDQVNDQGNTASYGKTSTRIDFLIEQQLNKHTAKFMSTAVNTVADKLEETLTEEFRDMIGDKIATKIGLNKLMPKMIKGKK